MKGGNCCNFETSGENCSEGPYANYRDDSIVKNTRNINQYCGLINNVYVFFSFHAFKHMEDLELTCYDIEALIRKINEELPNSYIAVSSAIDIARFSKDIKKCNFSKKNISGPPEGTYYSCFVLDPEINIGKCNYYVFEKMGDDFINIFVLGSCNYRITGKNISYTPDYRFNDDDNVNTLSANSILVYSNLNKNSIDDQYRGQKRQEEIKASSARAFLLHHALSNPISSTAKPTAKSTAKPTAKPKSKTKKKKPKSKTVPEDSPKSPIGSLETTEVISKGYFKIYKITPANISRLERIMENIENDQTIESSVIEFTDCHFQEVYPISPKVKIVNLIKCTGLPKFDENDIYELNIVNGTASLDENLTKWKLTTLRILFIENRISFPASLDALKITELVIINTIVQNINFWAKWPLKDLYLYYVAYDCPCVLPKIPTLENLFIYAAFELLDLRSIDKLKSCLIVSHNELNLCDHFNSDFKKRIALSNKVLANELMKANAGLSFEKAEEYFHDIGTTQLYSTSNFQFSKEIIYNRGFKCDCFSVSNINTIELLEPDDMVWAIMENFTEKVNSSSPTH